MEPLNSVSCLQHVTAVVLISLDDATGGKMASSVVSITLSSQVPVISIQHSPVIFLTLRTLLLCYRSSNATCLPRCCRSAGRASLPGSRRTSRPGASERGAFPRGGRTARPAGVPQRGGMLGALRPLPPPRRLLPSEHTGRSCACCRNLPFKSRLPPLLIPEPRPAPPWCPG